MFLVIFPVLTLFANFGEESGFPVAPVMFIDAFKAAEGITFNAEGKLFIAANRAVWLAEPTGEVRKLVELDSNLGMSRIGPRDVLVCDFGPTNVFKDGPNDDGVVWRVTPEGVKTAAAKGIPDPNFILMLPDQTFLVSDDGADKIYRATPDGKVRIWSQAVPWPNGLALSPDRKTLYIAQIFATFKPKITGDNRLWALTLDDRFEPVGAPHVVARVGHFLDGLAMDIEGRVYIADNNGGKIWRYDPETDRTILIAEGMPHVASLVFGEGDFETESLYATCTFSGGGKIWKIPVGVKGQPLFQ